MKTGSFREEYEKFLKSKHSGFSLFIMGIIGIACSIIFIIFLFFLGMPQKEVIEAIVPDNSKSQEDTIRAELPIRLKIPSINVNAAIEYVGLTSTGAMDVPKAPSNVAWFNLGPRPGEVGSAAIVGHFGWKYGSVFDNLHKLQPGDKIYTQDDRGITLTFVVRESRSFDAKADAIDVFTSNDGKSHLNLITCEGIWSQALQSYSKRLVVFTDKVSD